MPFFGSPIPQFDRGEWKHWTDADDDGEDTRQEILARDSLIDVTRRADRRITHGLWVCPYVGRVVKEAGRIDIDHVISLGEAHRMGGHIWDRAQKETFANDPENLLATFASANRAKSDHDSFDGMPPNVAGWGTYMALRKKIVVKYELERTAREKNALKFFADRWMKHRHWVKLGRVRAWLPSWMPGSF